MEPRWGILLSLLCMLLASRPATSRFVVESNSLQVTAPEDIKGTYESAIANFGVPQYGGVLGGMVVYPKANKDFCKKPSSRTPEFKAAPGQLPQVLLIDRGNCYFTLKVWYAQLAGASAVLIADDKDETLITMDAADGDKETDKYINNITIPSGLVGKSTADALKKALKKGNMVTVNLDWTEALPHPDERVEYELWTNSNDECGAKCDVQAQFMDAYRGFAQVLEKGGYTLFTPHYITWYCPPAYLDSKQCQSQCINNGRYCAPDPEEDFEKGYDGKDVVLENLRELCVFRVAKEKETPWVWWDYVTDFKKRCRMAEQLYNEDCSKMVIESLGIDFEKVKECVGDTTADEDNEVLRGEQEAQVGKGDRGDVTILPTVMVNDRQYRGKLEAKAVLKAVCSGFLEGTDPPLCLGADIQTNECDTNNGGCWKGYNTSACKDTFRGRVCECPKDPNTGVNLVGDGYTSCEPAGVGRCLVNNGGCWSAEANGQRFTACQENVPGTGCLCPAGFVGDGYKCEDIDECTSNEHPRCRCPDCYCSNTYGSYDCTCSAGLVYITDGDQCISTSGGTPPRRLWIMISSIVLGSIVLVAIVGYIVYKYRLRSYMDSEIRAIMAQYMPLDSQNEPLTTRKDSSSALTGGV